MGKIEITGMNWNGKKTLVTGADGFIGSHLTEALIRRGADLTALAQYNSFDSYGWLDDLPADIRENTRLKRGDIRDAQQMARLCESQDVVFHLAALIAIPYSYEAAASYVETNVRGTLNLLEATRRNGLERFIQTSTSEVYGTAQTRPIAETHPLQAQSPYAASKIGADMMALSFARSFDLPVVVLRPFNTYGPRQSERAVISTVIRQFLDPSCETVCTGDSTPKRDFNFVADTVSAFMAIAASDSVESGETYNAGSGTMVSIGEMIDLVRDITGSNKPVAQESQRLRPADSEVMELQADAGRLRDATGWRSEVDLRDGLSRTIDWWRCRVAKARPDSRYLV
ncbi:MAG: SDR family NAD(P)-dependent oxidoreductase [Rhodospirillales bacterium]